MPTQNQIQANRRNAQHSTGPRTAEGKAASSMNALKSGIDARSSVIPGEDAAAQPQPQPPAPQPVETESPQPPIGFVTQTHVPEPSPEPPTHPVSPQNGVAGIQGSPPID